MIERAIALTDHDQLLVEDFPSQLSHPHGETSLSAGLVEAGQILPLEEMERRYIRQVLNQLNDNRTLAARLLGVDRKTLYRKLKES